MKTSKSGYANGGIVGSTGTAPVKLPAQKAPAVVPKLAPGGAVTPINGPIGTVTQSTPQGAVRTKPLGDQPVKHGSRTRGFPGAKV